MNARDRFIEEMANKKGARLEVRALTRCNCGCEAPDRIKIIVGDVQFDLIDPSTVDTLIATLITAKKLLWGKRQ